MTLTEFLLARIAADESGARGAVGLGSPTDAWHWFLDYPDGATGGCRTTHSPHRVLAECAAKREVMKYAAEVQADVVRLTDHIPHVKVQIESSLLVILASAYANHPDYRDEWKL